MAINDASSAKLGSPHGSIGISRHTTSIVKALRVASASTGFALLACSAWVAVLKASWRHGDGASTPQPNVGRRVWGKETVLVEVVSTFQRPFPRPPLSLSIVVEMIWQQCPCELC